MKQAIKFLWFVALLVAAVVAWAIYASWSSARDLPAMKKRLEHACATYPLIEAKDIAVARDLRRSIDVGETNAQDIRLQSGGQNEGVFVAYPEKQERSENIQLQLVDVKKSGMRLFTVQLPVLFIPLRGPSLSAPKYHTMSCTDLNQKDLLGLILDWDLRPVS